MQNRKEEPTEFEKTIKNKLHDWWVSFELRHLWTARLIVYFTCLAAVVSVCFYLFRYFNLYHTDASSARYMLSAMVQSQAAIVAIVVSLTLIAVQLTASAYSPRVIDILKRNPDMWILLGCYGVSIFFGFIVLKLVVGAEGEAVSQSAILSLGFVSVSFEFCVSLAYWFGVFTFVVLFPYMWNIFGLLKPGNIIKRLATEITKDKIIKKEEDPIQPIVDIIHGSIMKYDLETTRVGLKAVTDRVIGIIETEIIGSDGEKEISERFCSHLTRVGRLTASRADEESTTEVIKNLENFGKATAGKGLKKATTQAVMSLEVVGKTAAGKELEDATWEAVKFLGEVGVAAAKQGLKDATSRAVSSLEGIGRSAAEKRLDGATKMAAIGLGKVGEAAAEKGLGDATSRAVSSLEGIGRSAAEKHLEGAKGRVAESLGIVGNAAGKQCLESATRQAATSLIVVGIAYVKNSLEDATRRAAKSLGLESATEKAARSLAELKRLNEEIVKTAIKTYESIFEEKDHDSFQKFIKLYKQKLEELRAEN